MGPKPKTGKYFFCGERFIVQNSMMEQGWLVYGIAISTSARHQVSGFIGTGEANLKVIAARLFWVSFG